MSFKRNDIVNKQRLRDALNEEESMGFQHNDIVTTYAMDKAIAEGGGGGGGDLSTAEVVCSLVGTSAVVFKMAIVNDYPDEEHELSLEGRIDSATTPLTFNAILYYGSQWVEIVDEETRAPIDSARITVSDNYELEDNWVFITGDGTISVNTEA